jgi:subtilisin family serine protease
VSAPAEEIASATIPSVSPSGYGIGSGSSDAAAMVSGVAALIRSKYPDLDAANVVNRIISTAEDKGAPGRDPQYGFGVVDAAAALDPGVPRVDAYPLSTADPSAAPRKRTVRGRLLSVARPFIGLAIGTGILLVVGLVVLVAVLIVRRRRA